MLKRVAHGRPFGVAILAEGIGLRLPQDELRSAMPEVERDEHGHIRLAEFELDRLLAKQVKERFRERGDKVTVEGKNIGYELRCAAPIPFDIEYTRDLGYGAVAYLKRAVEDDEPGAMITIQDGHLVPLPFGSFNDPETGRVRIRQVNVASSSYHVAREYMIRLDRADVADPERLGPIAKASGDHPRGLCPQVRVYSPRLEPRVTSPGVAGEAPGHLCQVLRAEGEELGAARVPGSCCPVITGRFALRPPISHREHGGEGDRQASPPARLGC